VLLAKVRRDSVNRHVRTDETMASGLEAVHIAFPRTEIARPQVGQGSRALLRRIHRAQQLVSWGIFVEEEGRCDVATAAEREVPAGGKEARARGYQRLVDSRGMGE
jgi:hypothetical protein